MLDLTPLAVGAGVGAADGYLQRRDGAAHRWGCALREDQTIGAIASTVAGGALLYMARNDTGVSHKREYGHSFAVAGSFLLGKRMGLAMGRGSGFGKGTGC